MVNSSRLQEIICLIREITKSDEMYLFGSYANGTQEKNSDIDIAIIKDNIENKLDESYQIRKRLFSDYHPIDLVFLKKSDFEKRKTDFGTIYYEIANKGMKI